MDVKQKIDFIKPALHSATIRWNLASTDKGTTKLTWKMIGTMPLFLSFLIPIMTHSIKDSYKLGLVLLRGIVDKNAPTCSLVFDGIQKIQDDRWGVYSSFSGPISDLPEVISSAYKTFVDLKIEPVGPPFVAYWNTDLKKMTTTCDSVFPVNKNFNEDTLTLSSSFLEVRMCALH